MGLLVESKGRVEGLARVKHEELVKGKKAHDDAGAQKQRAGSRKAERGERE